MTSPNPLLPVLDERRISVDFAIANPVVIRDRIAKIAAEQLVGDKFCSTVTGLKGGALAYTTLQYSDLFSSAIGDRAPLAEYPLVEGQDQEPRLIPIVDRGGKFQMDDVLRSRSAAGVDYFDQQVTQLGNRLAQSIDDSVMEAVTASAAADEIKSIAVVGDWSTVVTVGPESELTAGADRPPAHLSLALLEFDLDRLGVKPDLIVISPLMSHNLRVAYGDSLGAMLAGLGLSMFSHASIPDDQVYVVQRGAAGLIAFEEPLTLTTWRDEHTRSTWVQSFYQAAVAITRPYSVKRLTFA